MEERRTSALPMNERSLGSVMKGGLIGLLAASLSLVALLQVARTVLSRASHDWDLDAFLYLGSRLAEGELLYTHDFETKLPLVQYLFYWPYLLGGIGAWRLLNFGLVLGFGYMASSRLARAFHESGQSGNGVRQVTWYLTSLYLVVLYSLPGAESGHLEMVSASLVYLACAWLIASGRPLIAPHVTLDAACGFLVGLASQIRPNYVYVAAAMLVWMSSGVAGWGSIRPVVSRATAFVVGFGLAVAAAFLPYVVSGSASRTALADGLSAISAFSSGMDLEGLLRAQFAGLSTGLFYSFLYLGLLLGLAQSVRRRAMGRGGSRVESQAHLLALLGTLGVVASLLRSHYWAHNAMLFVPFATIVALVYSRQLFDWVASLGRRRQASPQLARNVSFATLAALTVVMLGVAMHWTSRPTAVTSTQANFSLDINDRNIDQRLMQRLQALRDASISFLATGYPVYHTRLGESRVGDGHPYMLLRALNGEELPNIHGLYLYGDEVRASPCRALTHSGKQVIVVATNDVFYPLSENCLAVGDSGYARLSLRDLAPYVFYAREDARRAVERALGSPATSGVTDGQS